MPHKLNISQEGKAWKLESETDVLVGRKLGDTINGKDLSANLEGYELTITGASDFAGFPHKANIEGTELKRVLLTKGWGMHKKPKKEGKKPVSTPKGLRLKKTIRGNQISDKTIQINLNVARAGNKKLAEIFPDQNKPKEEPKKKEKEEKPMEEEQKEEIKEEITEEVKEEIKDGIPESPETATEEKKEEAAEKVAEEVAEEVEEAVEEVAEEEKKEESESRQ